jgi:hypothetical protein
VRNRLLAETMVPRNLLSMGYDIDRDAVENLTLQRF